jgi:hypothetical protein
MADRAIGRLVKPDRPDLPVQEGGHAGRVHTAPASTTARLLVTLTALPDGAPLEALWQPRAHQDLPSEDDRCLVVFDDDGEAWVPVWWPS